MNTIRLNTIGEVVAKKTSGGAEINNQEKTIDITENGTTEVAPDSGFTGLSKVIVNTDVQGGEGGSTGGAGIEYLDVRGLELTQGSFLQILTAYSMIARVALPGDVVVRQIGPSCAICYRMFSDVNSFSVEAVAFDPNARIIEGVNGETGPSMTVKDFFTRLGQSEQLAALPRITEEEFYNLNA